jgi:hypothetical protein
VNGDLRTGPPAATVSRAQPSRTSIVLEVASFVTALEVWQQSKRRRRRISQENAYSSNRISSDLDSRLFPNSQRLLFHLLSSIDAKLERCDQIVFAHTLSGFSIAS